MVDIAVIGAGLSGLICAQYLQRQGYGVSVFEKSRGVGGRVATRRLPDTCADHGVRYLHPQGSFTKALLNYLLDRQIIQPWASPWIWTSEEKLQPKAETYYAARQGMTAIAKPLAAGLTILRQQRVTSITPTPSQVWSLKFEDATLPAVEAKAVVLSIPAPQALELLNPIAPELPQSLLDRVRSVRYDPCFSVIATYSPDRSTELATLPWQAVEFTNHADLIWLSNESSKRAAEKPLVVVQSSNAFATHFLEAEELSVVGRQLLSRAAQLLDWLEFPDAMQVHRWRYAFVSQPIEEFCLVSSAPLPLACSGDWCGGGQIEGALRSGFATGIALQQRTSSTSQSSIQENTASGFTDLLASLTA